eukprot:TRINITY_DN5669_c0_g1_i1.p1 TRINITY_DN5669_c0_g1~~TRINITY_DN5669_c0_g1_i1.p1  ORF type:complete len:487 (-),score=105.35 TRINITY_DN5669_c0_g1_i1:110-1570(-)
MNCFKLTLEKMNGGNSMPGSKKRTSSLPHQVIIDRFCRNAKKLKTDLNQSTANTSEVSAKPRPIKAQIPASEIAEVSSAIKSVTSEIDTILKKVQSCFDSGSLRRYKHKQLDNITCKLENKVMSLKEEIESAPAIKSSKDTEKLKDELRTLREFNDSRAATKEALLERIKLLMSQSEQSKKYCKSMHELLQSIRPNIRVCCRIKPLHISRSTIGLDFLLGSSEAVQMPTVTDGYSHSIPLLTVSGTNYIFDNVFGPEQAQVQIFEELEMYVNKAMEETRDLLMLAVGEKGSGKHYTVNGPLYNAGCVNELTGVMPRVLCKLIEKRARVRCKGFNVTKNGVEVMGESMWINGNAKGVYQIIKEYAMESEKCIVKHSVFQMLVSEEGHREFAISFAILEDSRANTKEAEEREFITQSHKALAEVLRVLADTKLKSKLAPPCKASALTRSLASLLTPETFVIVAAHVTSQDGAGTQATLKFLRNSLLLI